MHEGRVCPLSKLTEIQKRMSVELREHINYGYNKMPLWSCKSTWNQNM